MTTQIDKGRFSLDDNAQVLWQKDSSNPLPGVVVASMTKGDALFAPKFTAVGTDYPDQDKCVDDVQAWFTEYLDTELGGILRFAAADELPDHMKEIAAVLKEKGGVIQRFEVQDALSKLDADQRKIIRQHRVRLGPLLAFFFEHLKPAPLKLKSILWGVYHDMDLPVFRPKDGIVSQKLDIENIDHDYFRMLGYPVFAKRAIRIDMLDRVVTDLYDQADKGQFRAQHKYAEWLGCGIEDLYAVLQDLGHKKIEESEAKPETAADNVVPMDQNASATPVEPAAAEAETKAEVKEETAEAKSEPATQDKKDVQAEKPELAMFWLKRGKLSHRGGAGGKKPFQGKGKPKSSGAEKSGKPKKKFNKKDLKKGHGKDRGARVITAEAPEALDEDNPFAALKDIKF